MIVPATTAPLAAFDAMPAVRLVLGVARLGEADLAGWWSSQGMNPAVAFALTGLRRTSKIVGAELALLSAVRRHRQVLPRDTAVHLFSVQLPSTGWTSAYLAEQKSNGGSSLVNDLASWRTTDAARTQLRRWCDDLGTTAYTSTTVSAAELTDPDVMAALITTFARGYIDVHGELTVPYVDLTP